MSALILLTAYSFFTIRPDPNLLMGNWNVVNDSSFNTNKLYMLSSGDSDLNNSIYNGEECNATFHIYSNGNLVTSFFNCSFAYPSIDSAKYILAGDLITISIFAKNSGCCEFTYLPSAVKRTYLISNLTAKTATLTYKSVYLSPSGVELGVKSEIIVLKK